MALASKFSRALAAFTLLALVPSAFSVVQAQAWPAKPVRVVLTISGGGETNARVVMDKMSSALGVPFVVESQSGAGGAVGATTVKAAPADGYTLLYGTNGAMTLRRFLVKDLPYDTLRDFIPVARIGEATSAVAAPAISPFRTLGDAIEFAKKNPGKLS